MLKYYNASNELTISLICNGVSTARDEGRYFSKITGYTGKMLPVTCMLHKIIINLHDLPNMHVVMLMYVHVSWNIHGFGTLFKHVPCMLHECNMHGTNY